MSTTLRKLDSLLQQINPSWRGRRVLVCGGRRYASEITVFAVLDDLCPILVIHGACPTGADQLASKWARASKVKENRCPAEWKKHGVAAGPIRNQRMLDEQKPDLVVAFPGGPGTADMVRRARKAGLPVLEIAADADHQVAAAEPAPVSITDSMAAGLIRVRDRGPEAWCGGMRSRTGGAVSRMFDRMASLGLCTPPPHRITEKGRRALQPYEERLRVREQRLLRKGHRW